jgi:histidyl-tRNA synthetase
MYTFPDKKGRSLSLRPEATPSVIRAYLEHSLGRRARVAKYFYMGPMFRYDRPGQGRYRQFHQLGIEAIGTGSATADAEVIRLLWEFLTGIGLERIRIRLNTLGCKECRIKYSGTLKDFLEDRLEQLCGDCHDRFERNPLRILDCKNKNCKTVIKDAPDIGGLLCEDDVAHLESVKRLLTAAGVDFYVDARLVRGLDYYTRTVFEVIHESAGEDLALGGGGRYDELVEVIGGPSTPAVGFSLGLERVITALTEGSREDSAGGAPDVFIAPMGDDAADRAFELAGTIRKRFSAWLEFDQRRLDRQLKSASKMGVKFTVILGSEELARGMVTVKDMDTGEQTLVKYDDIVTWLSERIGG